MCSQAAFGKGAFGLRNAANSLNAATISAGAVLALTADSMAERSSSFKMADMAEKIAFSSRQRNFNL